MRTSITDLKEGDRVRATRTLTSVVEGTVVIFEGKVMVDARSWWTPWGTARTALGEAWTVERLDEPVVTRTGKVLTDDDIQALADEAEAGYDLDQLTPIPGHDGPGHTADGPADCPRCALLREHGPALEAAAARVEAELHDREGARIALRQRQDAERVTMARRHAAERAGFESAVTPFRPDLLP
jgi:hypothetical protein